MLLPWGIRNQRRYGEFFLTDSHGGHTALVGANPNTDGVYSPLAEPDVLAGHGLSAVRSEPRDARSRRVRAGEVAGRAFEPAYALGLVAAKADRLLTNERPLLYWPLYRESVLPAEPRARWFFDRHRAGSSGSSTASGTCWSAAAIAGLVVAASRAGNWRALALLPFPLALIALYATFFSEVRYHLAIAIFMFPYAGAGAGWVGELRRAISPASVDRRGVAALALACWPRLLLVGLFVGWPVLAPAPRLRDRHRWAVVASATRRTTTLATGACPTVRHGRASPVRGVWNGVGLRLHDRDRRRPPVTHRDRSAAGRYRITARADCGRPPSRRRRHCGRAPRCRAAAHAEWPAAGSTVRPRASSITMSPADTAPRAARRGCAGEDDVASTVWLSDIRIERDPTLMLLLRP